MNIFDKKTEIYNNFAKFLSTERVEKIDKVALERTRYLTAVLEDVNHQHNASAALRSIECFGIQDVHVIENRNKFSLAEDVAKGAGQWITINRYNDKNVNNSQICFEKLRKEGYVIASTTPGKSDIFISEVPLDKKVAIVFGSEVSGISDYAKENSDFLVKVPMYGFTESFNISVCASLCLYDLTQRIRSSKIDWRLSEMDLIDLKIDWLIKNTGYGSLIKKELKSL